MSTKTDIIAIKIPKPTDTISIPAPPRAGIATDMHTKQITTINNDYGGSKQAHVL